MYGSFGPRKRLNNAHVLNDNRSVETMGSNKRNTVVQYLFHACSTSRCFRVKPIAMMLKEQKEEDSSGNGLNRTLSLTDVIAYGIGSTVGAGLFVVTGKAARDFAGPAVSLSFTVAALACLFSAFCYAEFAARVPVSGSAYSYAYASVGEGIAWFIGWNLTLEYGISAAAIARGWSNYFVQFLLSIGIRPPLWTYDIVLGYPPMLTSASPLAGLIIAACSVVLLTGVKESSKMNVVITILNMAIVGFIVLAGSTKVQTANWEPFMPYGMRGVFSGAGFVFFSFIGFDCVCTLSEEMKNPQRDLPRGIVATLAIVTVLYIAVGLVVTGMVNYLDLNVDAPLSHAFMTVNMHWASSIVAFGSTTTLTATTLCSLFGQPRIFYRMSKDGLLFESFSTLSKVSRVPVFGTIVTGIGAATMAVFFDIDTLTDMISIGTLMAFTVVCLSVLILRFEVVSSQMAETKQEDLAADPAVRGDMGVKEAGEKGDSCPFPTDSGGIANADSTRIISEGGKKLGSEALLIVSFFVLSFFMNLVWVSNTQSKSKSYAVALLGIASFAVVYKLSQCEQAECICSFQCPFVPWFPCIGITFNMHLIMGLPVSAFYRMCIWSLIGFFIYFFYGMKHSSLEIPHSGYSGVPEVPEESALIVDEADKNNNANSAHV